MSDDAKLSQYQCEQCGCTEFNYWETVVEHSTVSARRTANGGLYTTWYGPKEYLATPITPELRCSECEATPGELSEVII